MKIRVVEAELLLTDRERQAERHDSDIRRFSQFLNKINKVTQRSVVMILSPRSICRLQSMLGIP
jgi:hypothetical protein